MDMFVAFLHLRGSCLIFNTFSIYSLQPLFLFQVMFHFLTYSSEVLHSYSTYFESQNITIIPYKHYLTLLRKVKGIL